MQGPEEFDLSRRRPRSILTHLNTMQSESSERTEESQFLRPETTKKIDVGFDRLSEFATGIHTASRSRSSCEPASITPDTKPLA